MRVSVIIPTYNYAHFLPECIDSVLAQTVLPDEIVIVDDGSTDNTPEIIKPYLSHSLIKYIRTENSGPSSARNTAITASTGEIIALLDSDDIWHKNKLELQLPLFSNPKIGVVYSGVEKIGIVYSEVKSFDDSGCVPRRSVSRLQGKGLLWKLMQHNVIATSSALVRRECFSKVGMFHPDFRPSEDYHVWLKIAAAGFEFVCVDEPLIGYRTGHDSLSSRIDKRYTVLPRILKDVSQHPEFGSAISSRMLRTASSAIFAGRADWQCERGNRWKAFADSIRSICCRPTGVLNGMAWRVLVKSLLPKRVVTTLRRLNNDN